MNRRDLILAAGAVAAWPLYDYLKPAPAWAEGVDVQAILHDPDAPETGNLEKPSLGDLMSLVQIRHIKLWFAGRAQN